MELILSGRPVDAGEALDIGLVNRMVPAGQTLAAARAWAAELAHGRVSLAEVGQGVLRFREGAGRHGYSGDP